MTYLLFLKGFFKSHFTKCTKDLQGGVTPIDSIVTAATAGQSFDRLFSAVWPLTTLIFGHWPLTAQIFCPQRSLDIWAATQVRESVSQEISAPCMCNPTQQVRSELQYCNMVRSTLGSERWPSFWLRFERWLHLFGWFDRWPLTECGRSCDYRVYGSDTPLILHPWLPRVQGSTMKLRLNTHAQYECTDLCAETKSKKCASDKNLPLAHNYRVWHHVARKNVQTSLVPRLGEEFGRISLCTDFLMRKKLRVYPKFRF